MSGKRLMATCAAIAAVATVSVLAGNPNPVHTYRTTAGMLVVADTTITNINTLTGNTNVAVRFEYAGYDGSNLVALALGGNPTSNQVFAMDIDCASSVAHLVVFDKSNSNKTTIATSASIDTLIQQTKKSTITNEERFVALFNINPTNDLLGGFLTVAGRLHLTTNGCPHSVLVSVDRDPEDSASDDRDVPNGEQDHKSKDVNLRQQRLGQAHFIGVLDAIIGGGTNTVLIPRGHMTFRHELE
jgi:hypothetical protein